MNALEITEGPERLVCSQDEDGRALQTQVDKIQRVEWIRSLAPWRVMATFTFRWEAGIYSAQRCFEKWMRQQEPGVSYYEAIEANPGRDGYHVHSLWADCAGVYRREAWASWFKRYGRAQIEPVRSAGDVAAYASKYLVKDDSWWNVKLQWHRMQAIKSGRWALL